MNFDETFPLVYFLNLGRDQERRMRCQDLFEEHQIVANRFPAVDGRWITRLRGFSTPQAYAWTLSIRLIIRRARQRKASAVFIFEDDVCLASDWRKRLAEILLPDDWELFFLGCEHQVEPTVVRHRLVRSSSIKDTHAWGIRSTAYQKLLKELKKSSSPFSGRLVRKGLRSLTNHPIAYAAFPNLAWQHSYVGVPAGEHPRYTRCGSQKRFRKATSSLMATFLGGKSWRDTKVNSPSLLKPHSEEGDQGLGNRINWNSGIPSILRRNLGRTAFLFLTRAEHNHPDVWDQYWADNENRLSVYSHVAGREDLSPGWLKDSLIDDHITTAWGDISLVRAQLALLHSALKRSDNQFFVFASESCIPIKPFREWERVLQIDDRSRFRWSEPDEIWRYDRQKANRHKHSNGVPRSSWIFHSQWIMLNRDAAELVSSVDLTSHFENVFAADESYFGTLLRLQEYPMETNVVPLDATWADWKKRGPHPEMIVKPSPEQLTSMMSGQFYFARKFSRDSNVGALGLHLPAL